jgi:hypothetical protein
MTRLNPDDQAEFTRAASALIAARERASKPSLWTNVLMTRFGKRSMWLNGFAGLAAAFRRFVSAAGFSFRRAKTTGR